jgi:hypothetical protein
MVVEEEPAAVLDSIPAPGFLAPSVTLLVPMSEIQLVLALANRSVKV